MLNKIDFLFAVRQTPVRINAREGPESMPKWEEYKSEAKGRGAMELSVVRTRPTGDMGLVKATLPDLLTYQKQIEDAGALVMAGNVSDETGDLMEADGMNIDRAANLGAALLDKIVTYKAVHEIDDLDELRRRLSPPDRRCLAFFHPAMPDEPLIFVEVALTATIPGTIDAILSPIPRMNTWLLDQTGNPDIGHVAATVLEGDAPPEDLRAMAARYLVEAKRENGKVAKSMKIKAPVKAPFKTKSEVLAS